MGCQCESASAFGNGCLKKNAIESGDLPHPPEHTHKSQKESLACDICHGWIKRRDAIMQQALPPRIFQDAKKHETLTLLAILNVFLQIRVRPLLLGAALEQAKNGSKLVSATAATT
jgi:hypothetical protein